MGGGGGAVERRRRTSSQITRATTDDSARGQGIFPALERRHEEQAEARGAAVVLAFASKPTEPIFLGPLGWTEVGRLRIWARPLPGVLRPRSRAEPVDRFAFARDAASSWPNHVVRDADYLNWRYLDSPRGYRAFAYGEGYSVLGHKRHRGVPIALVADLAGEPRPLLKACVAAARPGTRAVFAVPAPEHRATYAALGFVPSPLSLHFMGKPLAGSLNPDPRAWRFTLGDTDFF